MNEPGSRAAPDPGTRPPSAGVFRPGRQLLAIGLASSAAVLATTGVFVAARVRETGRAAESFIASLAEVKHQQVADWREARLREAQILAAALARTAEVGALLREGASGEKWLAAAPWLALVRDAGRYAGATLTDAAGTPVLVEPAGPPAAFPGRDLRPPPPEPTAEATMTDVLVTAGGERRAVIFAPVRGLDGRGLGTLRLDLDVAAGLFPLLRDLPVTGGVAETFLVARDGGEVVYLSDRSLGPGIGGRLRAPLRAEGGPGVRAALGERGPAEATDRLGRRMLWAARPIPGSTWVLVAAVDAAGVFKGLRREISYLALLGTALLAAGWVAVGLVWARGEARHAAEALALSGARLRAEGDLRASEARLALAVEAAGLGTFDIDLATGGMRANERWLRILGLDPKSAPGTVAEWEELVYPEDRGRLRHAYRGCLTGQITLFDLEYRVRTAAGSWRWVHALGRSIDAGAGGGGRRLVGIHEDIGERKAAEERVRALNAELSERVRELDALAGELRRSNRDLEQFASVASHDLREPLRMVTSFGQLLGRRCEEHLDAEGREYLAFLLDGAHRMERMIEDLLEYSRVTTRGREPQRVSLEEPFAAALANLAATIEERGARVTHDALPTVRADAAQMTQLFQNLVGNAIKFTEGEAPRVHVSAARAPQGWEIAVRDHGIGIDPRHHEQIFQVFRRLHGPERFPGTGMGLAICRRIAERHGGSIRVDSAPGQGAVFTVTLPAEEGSAAPGGAS